VGSSRHALRIQEEHTLARRRPRLVDAGQRRQHPRRPGDLAAFVAHELADLDQLLLMAQREPLHALLAQHAEQHHGEHRQHDGGGDRARQHRVLAHAPPRAHVQRQAADVHRFTVGDALQVARQRFAILVAVGDLARQQLVEHGLEVARRRRHEVAQPPRRAVEDLVQHRLRGARRERQFAGDRLEDRDPERIEVARRPQFAAERLLRRAVVQRAEEARVLGGQTHRGVVERLGEAEVGQRERAVDADQEVARLDVAVQQAAAVREPERVGDAGEAPRGVERRHRLLAAAPRRGDVLVEAHADDAFHGEEQHALRLAVVVDRHDVTVVQRRGRARFGAEPLLHRRVAGVRRRQHLDRDLAFELLLPAEVDRAHAAAAEHALDGVRSDARRRRGRVGAADDLAHQVERVEAAAQFLADRRGVAMQFGPQVADRTRAQGVRQPLVDGFGRLVRGGRRRRRIVVGRGHGLSSRRSFSSARLASR
jgi:hypothetical protein